MCNLIQVINYEWKQFKSDLILDLEVLPEKYIFRGQANADWELVSTFDRIFSGRSAKEKNGISNTLIDLFKNECDGRIDLEEEEWLPFARHHGLPTRIMDWTLSPYIAAFFAYSSSYLDNDRNENVAIYALRNDSDLFNADTGLSILQFKNKGNKRQLNQKGQYTLLNTFHDSIEEYFINMEQKHGYIPECPVLYKIILPKSESDQALFDLQLMGISYSSLFDDIESYAKSAYLKFILQDNKAKL